jgi:AraC-like DNA-binding protein
MSLSVVFVHALVQAVASSGVSRNELLEAAHFDSPRLDDIDARLSHDEYHRLQTVALELTGNEALGLHFGEQVSVIGFDVLAQLVANSATMRHGIESLLRFHRIVSDDPDPVLEEKDDTATFVYKVPLSTPACDRLRAEFAMVGYVHMVRHFAGPDRVLRGVFFEHRAPAHRDEYARIFGGLEQFDHTFTGVTFARELLDRARLPRHAELYTAVRSVAERKLTRLTRGSSHAERLKEFLTTQSPSDCVDMKTVARSFGLSVRSLRRKLDEERVSFADLLKEVRAGAAKRMLEDPARSIYEAAYAMGFSDPSAFHRAFKRWTGMTPAQYRATL